MLNIVRILITSFRKEIVAGITWVLRRFCCFFINISFLPFLMKASLDLLLYCLLQNVRMSLWWIAEVLIFIFNALRFYNDVGICQRCSPECQTCIGGSSNDCISCASGYTLERGGSCVETNALTQNQPSGSSVRVCPDGFWTNSANGCQPCHHTCAKCNGMRLCQLENKSFLKQT